MGNRTSSKEDFSLLLEEIEKLDIKSAKKAEEEDQILSGGDKINPSGTLDGVEATYDENDSAENGRTVSELRTKGQEFQKTESPHTQSHSSDDKMEDQRKKEAVTRANKLLLIDTLRMIAILITVLIVFLLFFRLKIVNGNGMYPALMDGDLTLLYTKAEYRSGDIIYYTVNEEEYCGRVVAKGGDTLSFSSDGRVYVNGSVQSNEILFPTDPPSASEKKIDVPEGTVYVLGDYRSSTIDSRELGPIPLEDVTAKVIALLRHKKL